MICSPVTNTCRRRGEVACVPDMWLVEEPALAMVSVHVVIDASVLLESGASLYFIATDRALQPTFGLLVAFRQRSSASVAEPCPRSAGSSSPARLGPSRSGRGGDRLHSFARCLGEDARSSGSRWYPNPSSDLGFAPLCRQRQRLEHWQQQQRQFLYQPLRQWTKRRCWTTKWH